MAVVIGRNRTPTGGGRETDGQEGEEGAGKTEAGIEAWGIGVNVRRSLAYQDTQKDKGRNPGVSLKSVNHGEAEDGNEVGDDGNNDTANADGHGVVGDSTEDLAANDDVDNGKPASDEDIENGAQLGAIEAKRISRCSDSTETELSGVLVADVTRGRSGRSRDENRALSNLWAQCATVGSTQCAEECSNNDCSN
jgi:hypothetical protein